MRYLIFAILTLAGFSACPQHTFSVKATSLVDFNLRMLYIGFHNNLLLENNTDTNIYLHLSSGECMKDDYKNDPEFFYARVSTPGPTILSVMKKSRTKPEVLDTFHFTIKRVPDPIAVFGKLRDTVASIDAIKMQKEIRILFPCYYQLGWYVTNFSVSVFHPEGFTETISTSGNILSPGQRRLINNLHRGDKLYVEDIRVLCGNCTARMLAPIRIRVAAR